MACADLGSRGSGGFIGTRYRSEAMAADDSEGSDGFAVGAFGKPAMLVSACLLGVPCNHLGRANASPSVLALGARHRLVPVCPEVMGGLPTPRPAAELRRDGRVVTVEGHDVTEFYVRGAAAAVALAAAVGAHRAVLKARSPSCGSHEVYDGTFRSARRAGPGVTAAALMAAGLEVADEEDELARSCASDSPGAPPTMEPPSGA
ncbi:MAG: hypothetical protein QOJ29_641 [Thermoleophilaceae bacterium]|nr:hypothetical protein [Thermoleophilaceae bacterium]